MVMPTSTDPRNCVYGIKVCNDTIYTFFEASDDKFLQEEILDTLRVTIVRTNEMIRVAIAGKEKKSKVLVAVEVFDEPAYIAITVTFDDPDSNHFKANFESFGFDEFRALFNNDPEALVDLDTCAIVCATMVPNDNEVEA